MDTTPFRIIELQHAICRKMLLFKELASDNHRAFDWNSAVLTHHFCLPFLFDGQLHAKRHSQTTIVSILGVDLRYLNKTRWTPSKGYCKYSARKTWQTTQLGTNASCERSIVRSISCFYEYMNYRDPRLFIEPKIL